MNIKYNSGTVSPPSSKAKRLSTQCGGVTGRHPAHCSSVTSTTAPPFLNFWGPLFLKILLFILGKTILKQNGVEFDCTIGHALVLFPFFFNNKQKMYGGPYMSPPVPAKIQRYRYIWT